MQVHLTKQDLINFELDIAKSFTNKEIPFPIHLSSGNEEQLIEIFHHNVNPDDWICCTWRSHYHCLLKGVPPDKLKDAIVAGKSISLCFPEYKIISSAIVGGMAPIAVGLAMGIKRKKEENKRKVVCFLGDMAYETGIVHESVKYSQNHQLPLLWVVEDNSVSVGTNTESVWGGISSIGERELVAGSTRILRANTIRYHYRNSFPHCGVGKWINF